MVLIMGMTGKRLVELAHRLSPAGVIPIKRVDGVEHGPVIKMIGGQTSCVRLRLAFAQGWIYDLFLGKGVSRQCAVKFAKQLGALQRLGLAGAEDLFEKALDMPMFGRESLNPVLDCANRDFGRGALAQRRSNARGEAQQRDSGQRRHRPTARFQRSATEALHRVLAAPLQVAGDLFEFWRSIGHGGLKFAANGLV